MRRARSAAVSWRRRCLPRRRTGPASSRFSSSGRTRGSRRASSDTSARTRRNRVMCRWSCWTLPVLYKAGWDAYCDIIIFVDADSATRAARARQRGWSDEQWRAREAAQPALALQRARADVVLDNSGTREQLMAQVEKFWQSLQADRRATNFRKRPFTNVAGKSIIGRYTHSNQSLLDSGCSDSTPVSGG